MELHHHPAKEHKLKEYLLEGLMIFIAVTMGFFAESLRENMTNREKEHAYISSLIGNLQNDKTNLIAVININKKKLDDLDSVLNLSDKDLNDIKTRQKLYSYVNIIGQMEGFTSTDATMLQLKNSGGLQYIKHAHIADSIALYDMAMRDIKSAEAPYGKSVEKGFDAASLLLVFHDATATAKRKGLPDAKKYPILTKDVTKLAMFFNTIGLERGWTENYIRNLKEVQPYNTRLIELLKKEYDE
jgi:hypothetical protein